jgi:integral membrane protein (TIGR01906 family)
VSRGARLAVGAATALVVLAISIVPFLSGLWIGFAQDRAQAEVWTGWDQARVREATSGIVADLLFTNGGFEQAIDGQPVLSASERAHMVDVRTLFRAFFGVALVSALALVLASRRWSAGTVLRAIRRGALGLTVALVVAGFVVAFAFDTAFALFHALFFAAGSWTFDPATDRLVQLFPEQFWIETTTAVGVVAFGLALGVAWFARRRAA